MRERPPHDPPRIVRPRKSTATPRPVIALSTDAMVVESLNEEILPISDLGEVLKSVPSSIIAAQGFGLHLQRLQRQFHDDPEFNYRVTPIRRYSPAWDDGRRMVQGMVVDTICNFVGWKFDRGLTRNGNPKFETLYHHPLNPLWFLTTSIDELTQDTPLGRFYQTPNAASNGRLVKLYVWAKEVRDWCVRNGLQVKASAGGIAAQLLRDSRFYPEPRRKAPRGVNSVARYRLPGNYYHLRAEVGRYYRALYLDMADAHHAMARRIRFPDVNSLRAYGDMGWSAQEDKRKPRPWAAGNSKVLEAPGLFHLSLMVPTIPRDYFPPPYMERQGIRDIWVYSNELDWIIRELGGEIRCVYGAFTSQGFDEGMNRYAAWAIEEIRANQGYKYWLKPTLHSTYGLLAARAVPFETGYLRAKGGEVVTYPMGNISVPALAKKRSAEIESRIVNVIHRGMIEAEVRKEALRYARFLTEMRERVLAIYADGIFIVDRNGDNANAQLRFLQPPWRLKEEVTNLRFHSATTFTSPQLSRLPGVPRTARERFLAQQELAKEIRKVRGSRAARANSPTVATPERRN